MVRDVARVVRAVSNMVEATVDVRKEVVNIDWICASSMVLVVRLFKPVVQVMLPMVNLRLSTTAMKSGMMIIWLA